MISPIRILALLLFLLFPTIATASVDETGSIQTTCPVMEGNTIDPDIYTDYKGKRVFFCCEACKTAFEKDTEAYLPKLPQFADATTEKNKGADSVGKIDETGGDGADSFIGQFHPIIVHFPVALIIVAALAEFLFLVTGSQVFGNSARFCIIIGALGAIAAITTGHFAEESATFAGDYEEIVETHETLGMITAICAVIAAFISELARAKKSNGLMWVYRVILLACLGLVSATGYYGGMLVFGKDHLKL